MSSEDLKFILNGLDEEKRLEELKIQQEELRRKQIEEDKKKKIYEEEEKKRKKKESFVFSQNLINSEFIPIFSQIRLSIPEVYNAKRSEIISFFKNDTYHLYLLWGNVIGLSKEEMKILENFHKKSKIYLEQYNLMDNLVKNEIQVNQSRIFKKQPSVRILPGIDKDSIKCLSVGKRKADISIITPSLENINVIDCNYLQLMVLPNHEVPNNPEIILDNYQKKISYLNYQFEKQDFLKMIGKSLSKPLTMIKRIDSHNRIEENRAIENLNKIKNGVEGIIRDEYTSDFGINIAGSSYSCYDPCNCNTYSPSCVSCNCSL